MGIYNAYTPTIRHITLTANQPLAKPIRIGMVSDLHLGLMVGERQINRLTGYGEKQERATAVDALAILWMIMLTIIPRKICSLRCSNSVCVVPMGAYATLGNHDMYGHEGEIRDAIKKPHNLIGRW